MEYGDLIDWLRTYPLHDSIDHRSSHRAKAVVTYPPPRVLVLVRLLLARASNALKPA